MAHPPQALERGEIQGGGGGVDGAKGRETGNRAVSSGAPDILIGEGGSGGGGTHKPTHGSYTHARWAQSKMPLTDVRSRGRMSSLICLNPVHSLYMRTLL